MPVTVEQYGRDPILMVTFTDELTPQIAHEMYIQSAYLAESIDADIIWRILDISQAQVGFGDVIHIVRYMNLDQPGNFADPRFHTVFAGRHPMASLIRDMLGKEAYGGVDIMIYPGLGEALMFAQEAVFGLSADNGV